MDSESDKISTDRHAFLSAFLYIVPKKQNPAHRICENV